MLLAISVASATGWANSTFDKRMPFYINSTMAKTNFQVAINITYDSDMQSDFSDIYFTYDNATNLNYWIEEQSAGNWAYVYLKTNLSAANNTFYIYYKNNSVVTSGSNGFNTMNYFSDFANSTGWTNSTPWVNTGGVSERISGSSMGYMYPAQNITNGVVQVRINSISTGSDVAPYIMVRGVSYPNFVGFSYSTSRNQWELNYMSGTRASNNTFSPEGTYTNIKMRFAYNDSLNITEVWAKNSTVTDWTLIINNTTALITGISNTGYGLAAYSYASGINFSQPYFMREYDGDVVTASAYGDEEDIESYSYDVFVTNDYELNIQNVTLAITNKVAGYNITNANFTVYLGSPDNEDTINLTNVFDNGTHQNFTAMFRMPLSHSKVNQTYYLVSSFQDNVTTVTTSATEIVSISRFYVDNHTSTVALENSNITVTASPVFNFGTSECVNKTSTNSSYMYWYNRWINVTSLNQSETYTDDCATAGNVTDYTSTFAVEEDNITINHNWGKKFVAYSNETECRTWNAETRAKMVYPVVVENVTSYWAYGVCPYTFENSSWEETDDLNVTVWVFNMSTSPIGVNAINISFYNESSPETAVDNVLMESFFTAHFESGVEKNFTFNTTNHTQFYFSPNFTSINLTADFIYQKPDMTTRAYYIVNGTLFSNTTQVIKLYLADNSSTSNILFTLKNANEQILENAYVTILRHYAYDGSYKTIAMGRTDANGQVSIPLIPYTVFYKIWAEYNNAIFYTSEAQQITQAELLIQGTEDIPENRFTRYNSVAVEYNFTTNGTNTTFYITASDSSGLMSNVTLDVDQVQFLNDTSVCFNTETGSTITLYCQMNGTTDKTYKINAKVGFSDGSTLTVYNDYYSDSTSVMGSDGLIGAMILVITLAMAGIWSPKAAILLACVGLAISIYAGFLITGVSAIASIIVVGIILIVVMKD